MSAFALPINLHHWIEKNHDKLKPPISNKMIFEEQGAFVQVVGGPNQRRDYHYNEGAEIFYQIKGDMLLKVLEDGKFKEVPIKEGEIFLLPPKIPHSPQRFADTIGLVIERKRLAHENDKLMWFCETCHELVYEAVFHLDNLEKDFLPQIDTFLSNPENLHCKCGDVLKIA